MASHAELLHARTIVDALLRQLNAANTALPPAAEDIHAAAELPTTSARSCTVWEALDNQQRTRLVLRLARLIAQAIATPGDRDDERAEQDNR
jgi:hypothetical protein